MTDIELQNLLKNLSGKLASQPDGFKKLNTISRPFSQVLHLQLLHGSVPVEEVYLKQYHSSNNSLFNLSGIRQEYEALQFWHNQFREVPGLDVVQPLFLDAENRSIVTLASPGQNLGLFIFRHARMWPSAERMAGMSYACQRAGTWLKRMQRVAQPAQPKPLELEEVRGYINLRMDRILENPHIRFDAYMREELNLYIERLWQKTDSNDRRITYAHSDFAPSNILVDAGRLTVLDFTKLDQASPYRDVSRFYHQMDLLRHKPVYRPGIVSRLQQAFLDGYGAPGLAANPMFRIFLLTHTINHLGKNARYWQHGRIENIYNRWVVWRTLRTLGNLIDGTETENK